MRRLLPTLAALACGLAAAPAFAEPLWEAGIGVGGVSFPQYRGASTQRSYALPLPYLVYRGEQLRLSRSGLRGLLYQSPRTSVDLSVDGAAPSDGEAGPREGMPDLDPVFEIGPSVNRLLGRTEEGTTLSVRLPLRAAVATDLSHFSRQGWLFYPHLNVAAKVDIAAREWNFGINFGPLFASGDYHHYYYGVEPQYATAARPPYQARGGYSGARLNLSLSRRFNGFWAGAFLRYDTLHEAVFLDSPLIERQDAVMAGFGISWILARSARTAREEPFE